MKAITVMAVTPDNAKYPIDVAEHDTMVDFKAKIEAASGIERRFLDVTIDEEELSWVVEGDEVWVGLVGGIPKEEAIRRLRDMGITKIDSGKMIGEIEARRYATVELLYYAGAVNSYVIQYAACHNTEALELLAGLGADIDTTEHSFQSRTALHCAAKLGLVDSVTALVHLGADINRLDTNGLTPLQVAIKESSSVATITTLVRLGADISFPDPIGRTPLHNAILFGTTGSVPELLRLGANPTPKDATGRNPFSTALKSFNIRSAWLLRYCC
eukprot:TRINITY_DN14570_c0_g1_i3.p1 TRINITY_DN14570_c0_g1~~TRINITY_DN14570_c0_g1_i3.p1  ORF type:complete len:272 (+),score=35.89 TRINITY_DN14570_c0_g1_i3:74-889(+)